MSKNDNFDWKTQQDKQTGQGIKGEGRVMRVESSTGCVRSEGHCRVLGSFMVLISCRNILYGALRKSITKQCPDKYKSYVKNVLT